MSAGNNALATHFSDEKRLQMAYEPVVLEEVAGRMVNMACNLAAKSRLPFLKQIRQLRTSVQDMHFNTFGYLPFPVQQRLEECVTKAITAIRVDSSLTYSLAMIIKKRKAEHDMFLTYLEVARLLLSDATRSDVKWESKTELLCGISTGLAVNAHRQKILSIIDNIQKTLKFEPVDTGIGMTVIHNLLTPFIKQLK